MSASQVLATSLCENVDAEEASHPVQVVLVARHGEDFGNDRHLRPVSAELLHQLLQVRRRRFPMERGG